MRVATAAESHPLGLSGRPSAHQAADRPGAGGLAERRWSAAALAFTLLFAGRTMAPAFGGGDVAQSDARQHIFWAARFRDPELFRDDLIADYFQSVAPPGYSALYRALSWVMDPLVAGTLLPFLLGSAAALFTFLLVRRLHPAPAGAFLASVLLSWYVWQYDDLSSAGPRAFLLPLLAAQLWSLAAGRLALAVGLVALAALLYPHAGALGLALLGVRLLRWRGWRPEPARQRSAWLAFAAAAVLVGGLLAPSQLAGSPFGPAVTAAQARTMPEFGEHGRNAFFITGAYRYWLWSDRSGLDLRVSDAQFPIVPILLEYLALAALLPLLLLVRRRLPAARLVDRRAIILVQLLAASFGLFFLAHLLLFRLHLPDRYVKWSLPLALAVAAGLALGILIEATAGRVAPYRRRLVAGGLGIGLAIALAVYPADYDGGFVHDHRPAVTAYLRAQPKAILVAGVSADTDSVPTFAHRRILVSRKYAIAYHLGYYGELRQRMEALIDAYYAESPSEIADFAAHYGVDLFLVNRAAFRSATAGDAWGFPYAAWEPFTSAISSKLQRSKRFALLELARRCAAVDDGEVAVVPTACLRRRR
jgi:hypothetical protein